MNLKTLLAVAGCCLATGAVQAGAVTFNDLPEGATLSNQYAAQGMTFTPNAFTGGTWATNTGMTVTGTDIPAFGGPSPVDGKLLHAYVADWLNEDGNPSFTVNFANGVGSVSINFIDVEEDRTTFFNAFDGATLLGTVFASPLAGGVSIASFAAGHITSVQVAMGSFTDWVGVDSITAVPEPSSVALLATSLAMLLAFRRRQRL
jgi:hypothetical protein